MIEYPTKFVESVQQLPEVEQSALNTYGLFVVKGLSVVLAEQLIVRSTEPHIAEYCPNDPLKRFKDIDSVEAWQAKRRLALPLVKQVGDSAFKLAGFGWMGPQAPGEDEPFIPGATTTFAIRIYKEALGQGNARPYTQAILDAHSSSFGSDGVWLEAWGDNAAAISAYNKVGFTQVAEMPGVRGGQERPRVYMALQH